MIMVGLLIELMVLAMTLIAGGAYMLSQVPLETALRVLCVPMLTYLALSVWRAWLKVKVLVRPVPEVEPPAQLIGEPFFDPAHGIMARALYNGAEIKVLLQPKWWNYLSSSSITSSFSEECPVAGATISPVKLGDEPQSLVAIYSGDVIVGFGSRVKWQRKTYLLTAYHVVGGLHANLCLAKGSKMVQLDSEWPMPYYCPTKGFEFAMVSVPDRVWSSLGVSASQLRVCPNRATVVAYGGSSSHTLSSSVGVASKSPEYGCVLKHGCPTVKGWSGTPLYEQGAVVGVHIRAGEFNKFNEAVNVGLLLSANMETLPPKSKWNEISEEEMELRADEWAEIEVNGVGKMKVGANSFALIHEHTRRVYDHISDVKSKGKLVWADVESDDEDFQSMGNYEMETVEPLHLNCQRAAGKKSLLPLSTLEATAGLKSPVLVTPECPSPTVDSRVASLEKLVERTLLEMSNLQKTISQNSRTSPGQTEGVKPNSNRSRSKHRVSPPLVRPSDLTKPSIELSKDTLVASHQDGAGPSGVKKTSRRRRRTVPKGTSTNLPLQGYLSQA